MQNQVASEAINSAKYVENYLDCVENLPNEIQRYSSRIREVDVQYREHLRDYDRYYTTWQRYADMPDDATDSTIAAKKARLMTRLTNCLIAAQELGDEKLQVVTQLQDMIELKTRTLDGDLRTLDYNKDEMSLDPPPKDPVIVTAPQAPFSPPIIPVTTGSILVATTSNVPTNNTITNERFAAAAVSTTQTAINERTSKRVRRSRTDTNSGAAIDLIPSDSINATIDIPLPIKQQASSTSSSASVHIPVASTAAVNKKTVAAAKKTKKRKTGRGQSNTNVSGAGGNASGGANNSNCAGGQANTRDNRDDTPPAEEAIDPDEPTYCLCDQISFGEMILCDNDLCPIEWFHFSCVSLMSKPKGKWFCPNCRGDRPNVMKPKQQFLKELERYNKEKEEKT